MRFLNDTDLVVLDEADQMLDMGFIPAMRRILGAVASPRQTVLLSATMPKPLAALAKDFQENPEKISVAPQSKPIDRIAQSVLHIPAAQKRDKLLDLLAPWMLSVRSFSRAPSMAPTRWRSSTSMG